MKKVCLLLLVFLFSISHSKTIKIDDEIISIKEMSREEKLMLMMQIDKFQRDLMIEHIQSLKRGSESYIIIEDEKVESDEWVEDEDMEEKDDE